jgi:hypothetical protein
LRGSAARFSTVSATFISYGLPVAATIFVRRVASSTYVNVQLLPSCAVSAQSRSLNGTCCCAASPGSRRSVRSGIRESIDVVTRSVGCLVCAFR